MGYAVSPAGSAVPLAMSPSPTGEHGRSDFGQQLATLIAGMMSGMQPAQSAPVPVFRALAPHPAIEPSAPQPAIEAPRLALAAGTPDDNVSPEKHAQPLPLAAPPVQEATAQFTPEPKAANTSPSTTWKPKLRTLGKQPPKTTAEEYENLAFQKLTGKSSGGNVKGRGRGAKAVPAASDEPSFGCSKCRWGKTGCCNCNPAKKKPVSAAGRGRGRGTGRGSGQKHVKKHAK